MKEGELHGISVINNHLTPDLFFPPSDLRPYSIPSAVRSQLNWSRFVCTFRYLITQT